MSSIFSKIISGEIPSYKVAENDQFIAILDIQPLVAGHVLVIPKVEVDYIFDNSTDILEQLLPFSKRVAKAVESVISCKRIGISVIGLEVPHTHVHLIPMNTVADMNFSKPKLNLSSEDLNLMAGKIQEAFI